MSACATERVEAQLSNPSKTFSLKLRGRAGINSVAVHLPSMWKAPDYIYTLWGTEGQSSLRGGAIEKF